MEARNTGMPFIVIIDGYYRCRVCDWHRRNWDGMDLHMAKCHDATH